MHTKRKSVVRSIVVLVLAVLMALATATTAFAYETLSHKIRSTQTFVPSSSFGSTSITHQLHIWDMLLANGTLLLTQL